MRLNGELRDRLPQTVMLLIELRNVTHLSQNGVHVLNVLEGRHCIGISKRCLDECSRLSSGIDE